MYAMIAIDSGFEDRDHPCREKAAGMWNLVHPLDTTMYSVPILIKFVGPEVNMAHFGEPTATCPQGLLISTFSRTVTTPLLAPDIKKVRLLAIAAAQEIALAKGLVLLDTFLLF